MAKFVTVGKAYFPDETRIKMRTLYEYDYSRFSKSVKHGFALGKNMVNMIQFKRHDMNNDVLFEFKKVR